MWQRLLQSVAAFCYYKVWQGLLQRVAAMFLQSMAGIITMCGKLYYKMWQLLQGVAIITKCGITTFANPEIG